MTKFDNENTLELAVEIDFYTAELASLRAKLATAERDLAEAKAECLDVYGKLAISSEMAAQYIAAKVELERDLAAITAKCDDLQFKFAAADAALDATIADLAAANEAVMELNRALASSERDLGNNVIKAYTAECDLAAANARAAKLVKALEPFAVFAKARDESSLYGSGAPDDVVLVYAERWYKIPHYKITLGDCRAARTALDEQAETGSDDGKEKL